MLLGHGFVQNSHTILEIEARDRKIVLNALGDEEDYEHTSTVTISGLLSSFIYKRKFLIAVW